MSDTLAFMRPPFWTANAAVTTSGVSPTFLASWLCDTRPNRPTRWTGTSFSATIANPLGDVDVVVLGNHNLPAGSVVTLGGDLSGTITVPTWPKNGIPLNPFALVGGSPAGVNSITVSASGLPAGIIIGEVAAGALETIGLPLLSSVTFKHRHKNIKPQSDISSVLGYNKGIASRPFVGTYLLDDAQMTSVVDWFESTDGDTLPSVIIIDPDVNDARFVDFAELEYKPVVSQQTSNASERLWTATLTFSEYERHRW